MFTLTSINFQACDAFYTELGKAYSLHKQHRIFKIFRALMEVAIGFQLIDTNPTYKIANSAPRGRKAIWFEAEVAQLRDTAWNIGYRGLAVAIAIAYDTQMAPVDVRLFTLAIRRAHDRDGVYFETARTKTARDVIATISKQTRRCSIAISRGSASPFRATSHSFAIGLGICTRRHARR